MKFHRKFDFAAYELLYALTIHIIARKGFPATRNIPWAERGVLNITKTNSESEVFFGL